MVFPGVGSRSMVLPGEGIWSWSMWCSLESRGEMSHLHYNNYVYMHTVVEIESLAIFCGI